MAKKMLNEIMEDRIDFMAILSVHNANPNGDPLADNRPRQHNDEVGYMEDVCIKRKIRNRLQDMGRKCLYQSNDRADDGCKSLSERLNSVNEVKEARTKKDDDLFMEKVLKNFEDVRALGATIPLKGDVNAGIRGAVTVQEADSVGPVEIEKHKITKSMNLKEGEKKGSDTMGIKYNVRYGVYVLRGSINPLIAKKNYLTEQDVEDIKEALATLFENDESAARPAGSMNVERLYWWRQDVTDRSHALYPPQKVFNSINVATKNPEGIVTSWDDIDIRENPLPGLTPEDVI